MTHKKIVFIPLLFFIVLILVPQPSYSIAYGWVRDYNRIRNNVTIVTTSAGTFRPGMTVFAYRGSRLVGSIMIKMSFHSKVIGRLTNGDNLRKGDKVLRSKNDIGKFINNKIKKISYSETVSPGRSWVTKVRFESSSGKSDEQIRKIIFAKVIGFREKGNQFYSPLAFNKVYKLGYHWDGKHLTGVEIILKNKTTISCLEILTPQVLSKIKPPKEIRDQKLIVFVEPLKAKSPVDERPDSIPVYINVEFPQRSFGRWDYAKEFVFYSPGTYFLKAYTNYVFIGEILLSDIKNEQESLKQTFMLRGMDLIPGKNELEFFSVTAQRVGNDFMESGDFQFLGRTVIDYGTDQLKFSFKIKGINGAIPELQK